MDTLTEKAAYLRGLADGKELDESKDETKIINAIIDIISDITLAIADNEDDLAVAKEYIDDISRCIDALDADLSDVEELIYDECDGCICDEDEDEDVYEIECPQCSQVFQFDESIFDDDEPLTCPQCGYVIDEIEIEDEDED